MKSASNRKDHSITPAAYILRTALLAGSIAGIAGFFGGFLLYPGSNLAPLLCVPAAGVGFAFGMMLGIGRLVFRKPEHQLHKEFLWLVIFWSLTVFTTYKLGCSFIFVTLQLFPILLGFIIIATKRLRPYIPIGIFRFYPVYLAAALLFLITSYIPPVIPNKWVPEDRRPVYTESNPMPEFVFCADPRLDASQSFAELNIDNKRLLQEWAAITVGTGFLWVIHYLHLYKKS